MDTESELKPNPEALLTAQAGGRMSEKADSPAITGGKAPVSRGPHRIAWIDHLKTWAIFLVIFGHSHTRSMYGHFDLIRWIYAFHIPLFFLISGFLIKESHLAENLESFLRRGVKSLILPYLVFAVIGYLFWFFVERRLGKSLQVATPPLSPIWATLYGTGKPENFHMEPIVLWFLPCLFAAQTLFYLTNRVKGRTGYVISIVLFAIGVSLPPWLALPFQFETALAAQFLLLLGFEAKRRKWLAFAAARPVVWGLGLLILGTIFESLNQSVERVDMHESEYGNALLFLLPSIGLSLAFALLLTKVPRLSLSEIISRNTLIIFSLHPMVFSIFSAIFVFVLKQPITIRQDPMVSLVSSIINLLLLAYLAEAFSRAFPRLSPIKR
jgi:acyltransferase